MARFDFLDESNVSRTPAVSQALSCNLYAELSPSSSKTQLSLISRPGLDLSITAPGISRGAHVFNGLQYHIIGTNIFTFDGTTLTNISSEYSFPALATSSGPIQFVDNGLQPAGGNQILFTDYVNAYCLNVNPQPTIVVNGDGDGASAVPVFTDGILTSLTVPAGSYTGPGTGSGSGYFSTAVSIIGGNPTMPASATAVLGGSGVNEVFMTNSGVGYYSGTGGISVGFSAPDIGLLATSPSSFTLGSASGTFIVPTGLSISIGEQIAVWYDPVHYAIGTVISYSGSDLILNNMTSPATNTVGTGTYLNWSVYPAASLAQANVIASDLSAGKIIGLNLLNSGAGYVNIPTITIVGGNPIVNASAACNTFGSAVIGYNIVFGGEGYGRPFLQQLLISGPNYPADSPVATVTLSSGALGSISVSDPSSYIGYANSPSCIITGGGGLGGVAVAQVDSPTTPATAACVVTGGVITDVVVINGGAGYTTQPIVSVYDSFGNGSGAILQATLNGVVSGVTITNGGSYYAYNNLPTVVFTGGGYTRIAQAHVVMGAVTGNGDAPVASVVMDDEGAGYVSAPGVTFVGGYYKSGSGGASPIALFKDSSLIATGTASLSAGIGAINIINGGTGYTGTTNSVINATNIQILNSISSIGIAYAGSGYTSVPTVTLGSTLATVKITNPGSGYVAVNLSGDSLAPAWNPLTAYSGSGVSEVSFGANNYLCSVSNTGVPPTNTAYWTLNPATSLLVPGVAFNGTWDVPPTALAVIYNGSVESIIITSPGSNYRGGPQTITFTSPSSGTTATGTYTVSGATATAVLNRTIDYVTVTNGGAHFTDLPILTITDPTGTGAALTPMLDNGQVVSIEVNSGGANYINPTISFSGGGGLSNGGGAAFAGSATSISSVNFINNVGIIGYGNNSTIFQTSGLNDFTQWSALDYSSKSVNNDPLVSVGTGSINGYMGLFGQTTMELWAMSPGSTPPFAYSSLINAGLAAPASLVMCDNTWYWLANTNNNGKPEFMGIARYTGSGAEVVSTVDINNEVQKMTTISDAIAYSYTDSGHTFYIITFPTGNKTYAFDVSLKVHPSRAWHRRSAWARDPYSYGRELVQNYISYNGKHYASDFASGNIYQFNDSQAVYSDNGTPISRLRIGPPIFDKNDLHAIIHNLLEVDMTTAVGGTGQVASASCTQIGGVIQSPITIINPGAGYIAPPIVLILDANGKGASATAVIGGITLPLADGSALADGSQPVISTVGQVVNIILNSGGSGYTSPQILLLGGPNNPIAILSWSDDDGATWTQGYAVQIGNSSWGAKLRGVWRQLGRSRKRTYRMACYDPVNFTMISGYLTGKVLNT